MIALFSIMSMNVANAAGETKLPTDGTYYVKVSGTGSYEISANFSEFTDQDAEPNDTMDTAVSLTSGVKVTGNAYGTYEDYDWYKFEITTKSYVSITLNNSNLTSLIYDANGECVSFISNGTGLGTYTTPGTYYFRVSSGNSYGYYNLTATIVEYPTVNEITSAVYQGSRKVDLTWSKSEYADGYYLFYKTSETGSWQRITTIASGSTTSYTHNYGPSDGQTYYYGVQAYKKDNLYGWIYNQDDAEGFKVEAKASLASVKAQAVSVKAIKVTWTANGTPTGYKIYRSANGGSYSLVKTITSGTTVSWKNTSAKKGTYYTYKVVPYVTSGTTTITGTGLTTSSVKLTGSLAKVTSVKAKKKSTYNNISWKKNSLATGYRVYRKVGSGSYKLVKTTTSASYKDKLVKKGKKYTYKIKAYYKNYTYDSTTGKYTSKNVNSKYSKTVSVKR